MEPEAIVHFNYTHEAFKRKTYEDLLLNNREVINKLTRYANVTWFGPDKINERLKCYITGGGNYKLYSKIGYSYKHKEDKIRKQKIPLVPLDATNGSYADLNFRDAQKEYFDWQYEVQKDDYINSHLDEFDVELKHYCNYSYVGLTQPIKIEL